MVVLAYVLISLHVAISVALGVAVMMQMSKSAELGGAFGGGASHTMFGRKKGLDTMGKITLVLAVGFMVNSVLIAFVVSRAFPG
ncbi:MAG TPA: preprotein translocase subunit SecG [Mesotoga sp.]|jgi:preprotein translocase subunit SecG|nr:preprotein translocase subunit SecG [Mesotoga sp.]NLX34614.1 preprotein translocase subunit SecG [Thermotogaceae bacterium]MDD4039973.1 preprotein translocase subunit SecG [Mesotoga sp.]MDD4477448.1 preprotein translocase subunit SecG [Mesotoga sp.]MDD5743380.1 preprotein translocase subunit SecG [Mesotoga sp.]